jgi:DNA-binding XRE family transcriptional regulator
MEFRPDDKFAVSERFKSLRRKIHLTQSDLGRFIGLCRQGVNEIENGHVSPHHTTWDRFCEFEARHNRPQIVLPVHWS